VKDKNTSKQATRKCIDRLKKSEKLYQNLIKVSSRTDPDVKLFYRHYDITPVTEKYLCVVVKILIKDNFINCIFCRYDKER